MTRVAFFGSHSLGEHCLEQLTSHPDIEIAVVVTYPREHDGWWSGSVHERALEMGHDVYTRDRADEVLDVPVEYLLSVYYPDILDKTLLDHPTELPLNLHQAELPRYRGSNVFSHSIMNARGDEHWKHGTTLHVMEPEVDAGDIIDRAFAEIRETDTARDLYERVCERSVELFKQWLPALANQSVGHHRTPQSAYDGERYFYAKTSLNKLKEIPAEALTDPEQETKLYDRIRALDFPPHEPAWTRLNNKKIYLTKEGYERF